MCIESTVELANRNNREKEHELNEERSDTPGATDNIITSTSLQIESILWLSYCVVKGSAVEMRKCDYSETDRTNYEINQPEKSEIIF